MSEVVQDLRRGEHLQSNYLLRGKIASNPAQMSDRVDVIIPEFHIHLRWTDLRWMSRDDTTLPSRGDACIVSFDSVGDPWVIAWWPFPS